MILVVITRSVLQVLQAILTLSCHPCWVVSGQVAIIIIQPFFISCLFDYLIFWFEIMPLLIARLLESCLPWYHLFFFIGVSEPHQPLPRTLPGKMEWNGINLSPFKNLFPCIWHCLFPQFSAELPEYKSGCSKYCSEHFDCFQQVYAM